MKWPLIAFGVIPLLLVGVSLAVGFALLLAVGIFTAGIQMWLSHRLATAQLPSFTHADGTIFDPPSGQLTPQYFEMRLQEEARRCDRYEHSMAVMVVKLLFKGTVPADWRAESASAAKQCAALVRSVDLVGALSPFEFGICLIESDRAAARSVRERLAQALPEYECHFGVVVYPGEAISSSGLVQTARDRCRQLQTA